jgi:hypothetical protein
MSGYYPAGVTDNDPHFGGDDVPQVQCPKCRAWQDDHDGFGVLSCACGYCAHPAASGDPMRCELCGELV